MRDPTPLRPTQGASWPDPPGDAAFHGLAGEIVRALDPHTEADPVGVLVSLLAGFGNAIGRRPHLLIDAKRHPLNVWPILVGPTGTGRKGTALANAGRLFERAVPVWWGNREGSLATGEGLIARVRDATTAQEPVRLKGRVAGYEEVITDVGVADKRLFVAATEFGGLLRVLGRENNILSPTLRMAWDGDPLSINTKTTRMKATDAHITLTGHITPEEVRDLLGPQETANGLANRLMWVCVRRSKLLPLGGEPDEGELALLGDVLASTIEDASKIERLRMDDAAAEAWVNVYGALATGEGGAIGQLLGRPEPMVRRLAGLYAALDASAVVGLPHLDAALELWEYADASVRHIFGAADVGAAANPYRGTILAGLAGGSLTQTEITRDLFGGNLRQPEPYATLEALLSEGLVERSVERPASGRGPNVTRWALTEKGRARGAG